MIQEVITNDGLIISIEENEFYTKTLNEIPFIEIKNYFIKKAILLAVKENDKKTNGKSGITAVQLKEIISLNDIQEQLFFLEEKKVIIKRKGLNCSLYFQNKKK
jgi:hypothetical protein